MLIRCEDCGSKPFNATAHLLHGWHPLPVDFFRPGQALKFWTVLHGHIPNMWTFRCECGITMHSGDAVAFSQGWDSFQMAQNDWGFCEEHKNHAYQILTGRIS